MLIKKLGWGLSLLIASRVCSQQVARATDVNLVTTSGTKLVLNGGITFKGSSILKSTADSIYLYTASPATSGSAARGR